MSAKAQKLNKEETCGVFGIVIAIIATLAVSVPVSVLTANARNRKAMEITIGNAEDKAREIIDEAIKAADAKKREASLEVKEETIKAVSYTHLTLPTTSRV